MNLLKGSSSLEAQIDEMGASLLAQTICTWPRKRSGYELEVTEGRAEDVVSLVCLEKGAQSERSRVRAVARLLIIRLPLCEVQRILPKKADFRSAEFNRCSHSSSCTCGGKSKEVSGVET